MFYKCGKTLLAIHDFIPSAYLCSMKMLKLFFTVVVAVSLLIVTCTTIDLYEKNITVPGHNWSSSFKPEFAFTIKDTAVAYRLYFVIRHSDKYHYKNIYINLYTHQPGIDSVQKTPFDLSLATDEKGWLGSGMDDIYEHRILLTPSEQDLYFPHPGNYSFSVEQIMREDPLENVMNVGIRIEKKQ